MNLAALDAPIETSRLVLRLVGEADLDGLFAVHGDIETTRFIPSPTWTTPADGRAWLARNTAMREEGAARRWAIVDRDAGRPVGDCMLFHFDEASSRAEIGFVLARASWGRGLMFEATEALVARAFGSFGARRLDAHVDPRNVASDRLLHRLGFVREGLLRRHTVMKGEVKDTVVYGLLADEWRRPPPLSGP